MSQLIPRSVLFGNPERSSASISPDGRRLGYLAPLDGVMNVWVGAVDGTGFEPVTADRDRPIRQYFWAADNEHLVYLQDTGGDENWHVHVIHLDTGVTRDVTPFPDVQAQIIGGSRRRPGELVLGLNRENPQLHDAYLLELESGELTKLATNPGYTPWLIDEDLVPRGGTQFLEDGSAQVIVDERLLIAIPADDALTTGVIGFNAAGDGIYGVSSIDGNAAALVLFDVGTGAATPIASDPIYDVHAVELHPITREVQIVSFERARVDHVVLDPSLRDDVAAMEAVHPGDLVFVSRDHADRNWITAYNADDGPVAYHLFDRETRESRFLFDHQPELAEYELARMEPFSFTSRDGLEIHGYLTFPMGEREALPTVLNVHGGPWARDSWGYDPTAQWLANRGYLCIQVNFRGSTGYGKEFLNAGDKEWGGRMHDDLIDAVSHTVDAGYADPARVAIYGGSYGGYSALAGAAFTPEVFACAVDIVGPSNLLTLIKTIPPYWMPMLNQFVRRVGDPETEQDFLWERSPLSKADRIRIPMLIAQGANDPRVKQAESEQIVAALEQHGVAHTYMVFEDEGHGFQRPENRMRFQAEAERFLAEHLGGRCEAE
jgi:dipeptidyl aminopeptidase/acylaminoacyl peptidase